jgi:alpha-2-macroglobulin
MLRSTILAVVITLTSGLTGATDQTPGFTELRDKAEALVAENSFALALGIYQGLDTASLDKAEREWLSFRLADLGWRANRNRGDKRKEARQQLEEMFAVREELGLHDRIWVELAESLAVSSNSSDRTRAIQLMHSAMDWWATSPPSEEARQRYLKLFWLYTGSPRPSGRGHVTRQMAEDALKLAVSAEEETRAHLLLAQTLHQTGGGPELWQRIPAEFEAAIAVESNRFTANAMGEYAEWLSKWGREDPDTPSGHSGDLVRALALYRRIVEEFETENNNLVRTAQRKIDEITRISSKLAVNESFLPGSKVRYRLNWRNVPFIDLALFRLELTSLDLEPVRSHWYSGLQLDELELIRSWRHETNDKGDYQPGSAELRLPDPVESGCYLLVASGSAGEQRAVILVTDLMISTRVAPGQALVWAVSAESGEPLQGVPVKFWRVENSNDGQTHVPLAEATTNEDGIAEVEAEGNLLILAGEGQRQAFMTASSRPLPEPEKRKLRVHAAAERPLFRPGERASFSFVARWVETDGYSTPEGYQLRWELTGPRRTESWRGDVILDEYGTASAFVDLPKGAALGLYQLFLRTDDNHQIDRKQTGTLFRVEEHRLPEMMVEVLTEQSHNETGIPDPNAPIETTIKASYYHGGAVQGAAVEAIVTQTAPWRNNETIHRESLTTDTEGRATLVIPSVQSPGRELGFTVEARVRDSSFREVVGRGHVSIPQYPIVLTANPEKTVVAKGEETRIHISSHDASGMPFSWTGTAKIVRMRWVQTWTAPDGSEYKGQELRELMLRYRMRSPTSAWKRGNQNWQEDEIELVSFETDDSGDATIDFLSDEIGEYRIAITAEPIAFQRNTAQPVSATVWVAERTGSPLDIGGIDPLLIVDGDEVNTGEELTLLVVSPIPDSWILLTVEGAKLESHRVFKLSGNSRKITLPIDRRFAPNIDLAVSNPLGVGFRSARTTLQIKPVEHHLTMDLSSSMTEYFPGTEAELKVKTTDHQGRPVRGRVFLAVTDDALHGIQEDFAPDIREFFRGDRRPLLVSSGRLPTSGLTRLVEVEGILVPEELAERKKEEFEQRRKREAAERSQSTRNQHPGHSQNAVYAAAPSPSADYSRSSSVTVSEAPAIELRTDFSNTAFWQPQLETDESGEARVTFTLPDSLTTWRAKGWGASIGDQYGQALTSFRTNRPLQVRLQAPRFLVEGDQATVSAMIDNRSPEEITVRPRLEAENLDVTRGRRSLKVPANTSTRVDWSAQSNIPGPVILTVSAKSADDGDGMQRSIITVPHGIEQTITVGGPVEEEEEWILRLPPRKPGSTRAEVQLSPGLAAALVDALPYLVDYPYGCTEQTMSRFLPAAVVARALKRLGLPADAVEKRIGFGKSDDSRSEIPGLSALEKVTQASLDRLAYLQHEDGHWGWWTADEGDLFMTAYVVWGLQIVAEAGVELDPEWTDRLYEAEYALEDMVSESTPPDLSAFVSCVQSGLRLDEWDREDLKEQIVELMDRSQDLSPAAIAMLAIAAKQLGMSQEAQRLARNLANGVILDSGPASSRVNPGSSAAKKPRTTAHWIGDGDNGRWFGGAVETTAWVVRALVQIAPESELIAPAEAWLVNNRHGVGWSNTRETAVAVLTLASLLDRRQEDAGDLAFEIQVNGSKLAARQWSAEQALLEQTRIPIPEHMLVDGDNRISVRRTSGRRPLEVLTTARVWSLEEPISAAGHGLFLRRQYFRIVAVPGLLRGASLSKRLLDDDEPLSSGDRIEAVITVESKNDLPYVLIEDLKPAGFEVVHQKSGESLVARRLSSEGIERRFEDTDDDEPFQGATIGRGPEIDETGDTVPVHQELRERMVALFIRDLPQGVWEVRYQLRAETPGEFHGLPAMGEAMYAPQIRANSAEQRVKIR